MTTVVYPTTSARAERHLTLVQQILAQATDPRRDAPDWAINLNLVDVVNTHADDLAPLVVRAVQQLLVRTPPNHRQRLLALHVLDTLVKNCGVQLHAAVCTPAFAKTLTTLAGKRVKRRFLLKDKAKKTVAASRFHSLDDGASDKELVQEQVLAMIMAWGPLHPAELPMYNELYEHLVKKGVVFPQRLDEDAVPWLNDGKNGAAAVAAGDGDGDDDGAGAAPARRRRHQFSRSSFELPVVPPDVRAELEGVKQSCVVLGDTVRACAADGSDPAANEIAVQMDAALAKASPSIASYIHIFMEKDEPAVVQLLVLSSQRVDNARLAYRTAVNAAALKRRAEGDFGTPDASAAADDDDDDEALSIDAEDAAVVDSADKKKKYVRKRKSKRLSGTPALLVDTTDAAVVTGDGAGAGGAAGAASGALAIPGASAPAAADADGGGDAMGKSPIELGLEYLERMSMSTSARGGGGGGGAAASLAAGDPLLAWVLGEQPDTAAAAAAAADDSAASIADADFDPRA